MFVTLQNLYLGYTSCNLKYLFLEQVISFCFFHFILNYMQTSNNVYIF